MPTLLIVDDSRLSRMMIRGFALEEQSQLTIIEAGDGDEALGKATGGQIDYMTIDYNMPGMDGITLARKLRSGFPNAKIAMLTANIQDSVKKQADEIGIGFIQKPITEDKIRAFVAA